MNWSQLVVIAVQQLEANTGFAVRNPIVTDGLHAFLIRDVDVLQPQPDQVIGASDLDHAFTNNIFFTIPSLVARQGHLLLVISARFRKALTAVDLALDASGQITDGSTTVLYLPRAEIATLRNRWAEALLNSAERLLDVHGSYRFSEACEELARQARYATDRRSDQRARLYRLLYQVVSNDRREAILELAANEFGRDFAAQLTRAADRQRRGPSIFDAAAIARSRQPIVLPYTIEEVA
jgi:hypothetical protein